MGGFRGYTLAFCVWMLVVCAPAAGHPREVVTAMATPDVLDDYDLFLAGRDPLRINDFSGPGARRDVVELVLLQQALAHGGLNCTVELIPGPSYDRILEEVRRGDVDVTASSCWLSDLDRVAGQVGASHVLIPRGRFEAGLYTAPDNEAALSARTLDQVRQLQAVCSRQWVPDWNTLSRMGIINLWAVHSWEAMVKMVAGRRADFVLAPFQPREGMALETPWGTLVPIPGIKVGLEGSRHFMAHIASKRGRDIFGALNRGLEEMSGQGVVERAYLQCGFYNRQAERWTRLH